MQVLPIVVLYYFVSHYFDCAMCYVVKLLSSFSPSLSPSFLPPLLPFLLPFLSFSLSPLFPRLEFLLSPEPQFSRLEIE